jgi:diacylglycerol kinase
MNSFFKSFQVAVQGIVFAWEGRNFRLQVSAAISAVLLALLLEISTVEWIIILFCIGLVLSLEIMNTSIEKLCDFVQPELDPRIKVIKDLSAGAVLIVAIASAIIGAIIFLPRIL